MSRTEPFEARLPHRGPALLLRSVQELEPGQRIRCVGRVDPDSAWAVGRETTSVWVAFEMAAQAAALLEVRSAESATTEDGPPTGLLVSLSDVRAPGGALPVGVDLAVEVDRLGAAGPLHRYAAAVHWDPDDGSARGILGIYRESPDTGRR